MKSFTAFCLFAIFALVGVMVLGDLSGILSTTQKIGYFFEIIGYGAMCVSAGWIFRSKQPDIKSNIENDPISNNRNSQ